MPQLSLDKLCFRKILLQNSVIYMLQPTLLFHLPQRLAVWIQIPHLKVGQLNQVMIPGLLVRIHVAQGHS